LGYLDGLRGWAALLVVFSHGILAVDAALLSGQRPDSRAPFDLWLSGTPFFPLANGGNLAVCLFFALSGYVLAHSYARSRQSWLALVARRYVRLVIPMLAGCVIAWALLSAGLLSNHAASEITRSSWLGMQFQQMPNLGQAIVEPLATLLAIRTEVTQTYDSSLWTMPIEALGSLVLITAFALAGRLGHRRDRYVGLACAVLTLCLGGYYLCLVCFGAALRLLQPARFPVFGRVGTTALFCLGLALGTVPYSPTRWPIYNALAAFMTPFVQGTSIWRFDPVGFWHGVGAALILLAGMGSPGLQAAFSRPAARFLGRISFPLYILHVPILMVVESWMILLTDRLGLPPFIGAIVSLLVFVAVALGITALVSPAIEGGAIALSTWVGKMIDKRLPSRAMPVA
jgi:peptidoglycan/LPS O-acetylase OafA/YrhL